MAAGLQAPIFVRPPTEVEQQARRGLERATSRWALELAAQTACAAALAGDRLLVRTPGTPADRLWLRFADGGPPAPPSSRF